MLLYGDGYTDYIAIYAAFVATFVALWEVFKWWIERLRLNGEIQSNSIIVHSENFISLVSKQSFISLRVQNRSAVSCTVNNIILEHYKTLFERICRKPSSNAVINYTNEHCSPIPYILERHGGEFRFMVPHTDELIKWSNDGWLYIGICHTMSSKAFWMRVRPIEM